MKQNYLRLLDEDSVNNVSDVYRHWCPHSEKIAGADALLTKLQQGYRINKTVIVYHVHIRQCRSSKLYHFRLYDPDDNHIDMPVLRNPFVMRLIERLSLQVRIPKLQQSSNRETVSDMAQPLQNNGNKRSSATV